MSNMHAVTRRKKRQAWTLLQDRQYRRARALYAQVCKIDQGDSEGWMMLAMVTGELGDYPEAERCCRRALQLNPHLGQAHYVLGKVLKARDDLPQAVVHFQQALARNAQGAEVHNDLGNALAALGRLEEAVDCYDQALRLQPRYTRALRNLGNARHQLGQFDQALDSYRQALAVDPANADAIVGIALLHETRGDYDEAYALIRPFLRDCKHPGVAISYAGIAPHIGQRREAIALMEGLLNDPQIALSHDHARRLRFQLGKLYDDAEQYATAFCHYQQGNHLHRSVFAMDSHAAAIERLIAGYSGASLKRAARSPVPSPRPVFIVGMPRSGTTLVEQILASHPQVYGAGELRDIPTLAATLPTLHGTGIADPQYVQSLTADRCGTLARAYLDRLDRLDADGVRVTDKMVGNCLHLGMIAMLFPDARVIHCVRDPLDTCLSCYFQDFVRGHDYAYDLEQLGRYYRHYERLMRHWKEVVALPLLEVRYEALVADQEAVSRALIDFCGLSWDPSCLRFYEHPRTVATASYDQVRRPIYARSAGRWRHYEAFLDPLKTALQSP